MISHQYMMEFLEVGGVLTLLEILGQDKLKDGDKTEALRLLQIIANAGQKYKELICESYGVKAVAECLAKSETEGTQETAAALLESLAHGNPKYHNQVYKGLISLMTCISPRAQQLVLQVLRVVQPIVKTAHHSIVEPLLNLLRSLHLEVQYEGKSIELITELMQSEVRPALLRGLVVFLKPTKDRNPKHKILEDPEVAKMTDSLPVLLQQAASAKTIRILAQRSEEISKELLSLRVIHHLLYAMGNQEHADAQRQASLALEHFVRMYPVVEEHVRRAMGTRLFESFMHNADVLHLNMDDIQADILRSNNVNISCEEPSETEPSSYHFFHDPTEISLFRSQLLQWYDQNKRELPWRTLAMTEPDVNIRTYGVWVSEIMLQQTQVATVIDYYNRWMKRWPTVEKLAAATLEEVNQMWAGLGYYSRGRRLHEGAQKVVSELDGQMPKTTAGLLKQLPGVGRYTAGAISSIALGQVTGAVDGNVIRVLCRVRAIGADSTSPAVTDALWKIADTLVDPERPGDFNQAVMELGATVCTPKSPLCSQCPIQTHCRAFRKASIKQETDSKRLISKLVSKLNTSVPDIENCLAAGSCGLCLSEDWNPQLGVQNYPRKPVKKAPRVEQTLTCVVERQRAGEEMEYLLTQRPSKGLLAGMWELPSMLLEADISEKKYKALICDMMQKLLEKSLDANSVKFVGEVVHIFSHIHQTYIVFSARVSDWSEGDKEQKTCWLTKSALKEAAVSTGVKKIMKLYESSSKVDSKVSFPDFADKRTDPWLLVYSPVPVICIFLCYLVIIWIGPKLMKNKEPVDLKAVLIVYNFAMVGLSIYMFHEFMVTSWLANYSYLCQPVDYSRSPLGMRMASVCWWFFFSKVIELSDTIFFILRKKNSQLTFLHVYHHGTMIFNWWAGVKYLAGGQCISRDHWHKRRKTGGKRKPYHKKRKYELGRPPANTKIGPRRIHTVRVRGGNKKYRALRLDSGNFAWGSECCTRKTRIIDVVYNASNNELVRTKTLVKNCIVLVDSAPFRQWYEGHYAIPLGRKKGAKLTPEEEEILNKKRSKKVQKKIDGRRKKSKISSLLEEQFLQGKLLACIASRPGQCGRADGYILEGKELEFYLRKIKAKKGK
ncbi:adenine DNA glycosylase-like protein [Labeo rohita]|uniref:40S ribosomal protein S8 n=1 Tax=Labeo rohita TaxID=84645 RepID=A0A498NR65_LABRO|nr:adenine DNA glycosylase-like protein [Labeo rohita]